MPQSTFPRPLALFALAGVCAVLPACGSSGSKVPPSEAVNSGLMALGSGDVEGTLIPSISEEAHEPTTEELVGQAAMDLEKILAEGPRRRSKTAKAEPQTPAPSSDAPTSNGLGTMAADTKTPDAPAQDPFVLAQADDAWTREAAARAPAPKPSSTGTGALQGKDATSISHTTPGAESDDRLVALAARLALMIRERKQDGAPLMSEAVALATIEAFQAGALKSLDTPGAPLNTRLSAQDRDTLLGARDRVAQAPVASSDQIREVLAKIAAPVELKIPSAKLCRRVLGFGRYDLFASNGFPAGRSSKAIVYTEIDGFGARPARNGDPASAGSDLADQVSVEVEQSLTLFQDRDGYQVWHKPPQRVVETSRTKRHDFYLIQIIELNASLAIGKYNLKVSVRDLSSGSVAETIIPIEIVSP